MSSGYKILNEEAISSPKNRKHQLVDATVKTPEGQEVVWQYIKTRDVVTIVAINDQNHIYCVRQWRPAVKDYVWELPAGGVEGLGSTNEQILQNANREIQEEISLSAGKLELLANFRPSIHMACTYHVILARDLRTGALPPDPDELIEIRILPYTEAYDLMVNNQTPSALTLIGLLLAKPFI